MRDFRLLLHLLHLIGLKPATAIASLFQSPEESTSQALEMDLMHSLLKEAVEGPLAGKRVTFLFPEELDEEAYIVDEALKGATGSQISLLRLPREKPAWVESYLAKENQTRAILDVEYVEDNGGLVHFPPPPGVTVMLTTSGDGLWWPLDFPPKEWPMEALLLISTSSGCMKETLLQSPLMQITPWAALLCPVVPQGAPRVKPYYKVWTWIPYASRDNMVERGAWKEGVFRTFGDLFTERFNDMTTKTINILAIFIDRPIFYQRDNGEFAGQTYSILETMGGILGYNMNISGGVHVGYSLIEDLVYRGINDVMVNLASYTLERSQRFQFTVPFEYDGFGNFLIVPPPLPQWQNVIYPFTWYVWGATIISFAATSVVYHIIYYKEESSFITNAITIGQSILSNPLDVVPEGWKARSFLLVWWMGSWILNLSYTCNLIAILTVPVFGSRIHTPEELAESNYDLCMLDYGEFVPEALKTSKQPILKALGDKMEMVPTQEHMAEMGEEQCVERVLAGTHAHTEANSYAAALYSLLGLDSKVYSVKEQLYQSYLVILVYKHAPWKYKLDLGMERLFEAGLTQRWYTESMNEFKGTPTDGGSSSLQLKALSPSHLQGPFLLLLGGLFLASLVMGWEVLFPSSD